MPFLRKHPIISVGTLWGLTLIISILIFTPSVPAPTSEPLDQTFWTALSPAQIAAVYSLKASLTGWSSSAIGQGPESATTLRFWNNAQMCDPRTRRASKALYVRFWPDAPGRTMVRVSVLLHDPAVNCEPF
jgi:hypothetical protein